MDKMLLSNTDDTPNASRQPTLDQQELEEVKNSIRQDSIRDIGKVEVEQP